MVNTLALIYFGRPRVGHKIKINFNNISDCWSWYILNFDFLEKGLWLVFQHILFMIFQEKCCSCYNLLTDQISWSDCLYFLDIRQYVYDNYLLTTLQHYKFWNKPIFLVKLFYYMTKRQKCKILRMKKTFKVK